MEIQYSDKTIGGFWNIYEERRTHQKEIHITESGRIKTENIPYREIARCPFDELSEIFERYGLIKDVDFVYS
ncbi:hypothetical protein HYT25_03275 [Candidatus Pacearchaeota archaeon]|nr:hypothetical protein [Candidatus Pacearchaeota archaeon]